MDSIQSILMKYGNLFEVHEVRTFRAYKNGTNAEVIVNVLDRGPGVSDRYMVEAFDADLSPADQHAGSLNWTMGNPASDLPGAIANAHWNAVGAER